jgi:hypothetical protein
VIESETRKVCAVINSFKMGIFKKRGMQIFYASKRAKKIKIGEGQFEKSQFLFDLTWTKLEPLKICAMKCVKMSK